MLNLSEIKFYIYVCLNFVCVCGFIFVCVLTFVCVSNTCVIRTFYTHTVFVNLYLASLKLRSEMFHAEENFTQ